MTESTFDSDKSRSKLTEMVVRGKNYREDEEIELFGEDVRVVLRPLVDDDFLPISAFLANHLDMDMEEADDAVSEAIDEVEEAREEGETDEVDVGKLDEEFVAAMQRAARLGIAGSYSEDGEKLEHSQEETDFIVDNMVGGASVEIGGRVLELSGDVRDAEKFPGARGSTDGSSDK